jgi:hypothetical protein
MARYNICPDYPLGDPRKPFKLMGLPNAVDLGQHAISQEMNFRLCAESFVLKQGGPITKAIQDCVCGLIFGSLHTGRIYKPGTVIYDVRTHYMQPGDTPSYALGWHTDLERGLYTMEDHLQTIHFTFLSGPPLTEFIVARNLDRTPSNRELEKPDTRFRVQPGVITTYNSTEIHRARPYEGAEPAWRYFFRATWFPKIPMRKGIFENAVYPGPTVYKEHRGKP